ncbi:MAG: hypothetical protein JSR47_06905 [Proteobacteria bacterium]|nr:hypothetical protein [Pseudomonadota bacterium]
MGPPNSKQSSAYVPPQTEGNSTLLGGGVLPAADVRGDLNRTPATSMELRFRHVLLDDNKRDTGFDHAYIVVTDNRTHEQSIHQAGPFGGNGAYGFPYALGRIAATTSKYDQESRGYGQPYRQVAVFNTDTPAEDVLRSLNAYGDAVNKQAIPYTLPDVRMPFVGRPKNPWFPTPNSNLYGGAAWQFLTGSLPELPDGVDAPGWGDHRLPRSPLK